MGRKPLNELPGSVLYSVDKSSTGEYTVMMRTTIKGLQYKAMVLYQKDNYIMTEAELVRKLLTIGMKAEGLTW